MSRPSGLRDPSPWSVKCRKVKHETRGAAKVQMSRLRRRGQDEVLGKRLNAYRCPKCGYWHVGHRDWVSTSVAAVTEVNSNAPITPELIAWAGTKAGRYILRYGDADGLFEPLAIEGLFTAARTYEQGQQIGGFPSHARHCVIQALNGHLRRIGPLGYRRDQRFEGRHLDAPATLRFEGDLESSRDPVGWEVDYEDFVESLARGLPTVEARVLRLLYLACEGGTYGRAGREIGKSPGSVKQWHDSAIRRIRNRFGVSDASKAAGSVVRAILNDLSKQVNA